MKFLLDENLSPLHARTLRALDHDAVSVVDADLTPDEVGWLPAPAVTSIGWNLQHLARPQETRQTRPIN